MEQKEKAKILDILLASYNDGRKKTLFCIAVNLLEVQELHAILMQIQNSTMLERLSLKEKSALVAGLLEETAAKKGIELKLRKKK